jgi:hypothetical protein
MKREFDNGTPLHLANAARGLQLILARREPQHVFIVEVGETDRDDARRLPPAPLRQADVRAEGQHPHSIGERGPRAASTRAGDDYGLCRRARRRMLRS